MDFDELLALLDIESPSDLIYFEQFADLMETQQEIPFETLSALVEDMEPETLSELVEGYFEDILKFVPDGEDELYTLLSNICTTMRTLAAMGEEDSPHAFSEELYKFRSWYLFESRVLCTDHAEGTERELPLMEALANHRAQNFTDDDSVFDFSETLDYPLEEYIVSLDSLFEDDDDYDDDDDDDDDYRGSDDDG